MNALPQTLISKGLRVVEAEGRPESAKLCVVGEALGEHEVLNGRPFCGPAGWHFDGVLRSAGLSREDLYITNVVPVRPPDNDLKKLDRFGCKTEDFYPLLQERLGALRPSCAILALGATAMTALTGVDGVTEWRGSILPSTLAEGRWVIPTFHPAGVMRMGDTTAKQELAGEGRVKYDYGSARISTVLDYKKAWRISNSSYQPPIFHITTNPSYAEAVDYLSFLADQPRVVFDIETLGKGFYEVDCIGLGHSPTEAMVLPFTRGRMDPNQVADVKKKLATLFWNHRGLVAQNGTFDMTLLLPVAPIPLLHFDTMVAHHLLYSDLPHSLAYLSSVYTDIPFYKWMRTTGSVKEYWRYNGLDCIATFQTAEALDAELSEAGLSEMFYGFVMPLLHETQRMGWRGIEIDQAAMAELGVRLNKEIGEVEAELEKLVGHHLNVRSAKQKAEFLYGELALPKQYNKKKTEGELGNVLTTDETALIRLGKLSKHPAIPLMLKSVEKRTLLSNFVTKKLDPDGCWRTTYSITGTDIGRLASKKTIFGTGSNLQNIPRGGDDDDPAAKMIKKVMVAGKGRMLVKADKSQAEARYVAWFARDEAMKDIFRTGKDIHRWNASILFNTTYERVAKEQRQFAKKIVHAFNYGLGPKHLQDLILKEMKMEVSIADCKRYIATYFEGCPSILRWHREIQDRLDNSPMLVNPFGRRRIFFDRKGPDLYKKGYQFLPASTNVDDIDTSLIRLSCRLEDNEYPLLQVHDEIVVNCPEDRVDAVAILMTEEMLFPVPIGGETLVVPFEIKFGPNWGETIPWNPPTHPPTNPKK